MPATFLKMGRNATTAQKTKAFIAKARAIHGRKYDYSRVRYKNIDAPVEVVCRRHGAFFPTPWNHSKRRSPTGCPRCGDERGSKAVRERHKAEFMVRAEEVHGKAYDYSKTVYKDARSKLTIVCPKHGRFRQEAFSHLRGIGCPQCGVARRGLQRREEAAKAFVKKARGIHGRKYRYDKTVYIRASGMIIVTCPKHGDFQQSANNHLHGYGCSKCKVETLRMAFSDTKADFIRKARKKHGDKFAYAGKYVNSRTPMLIRCKLHGKFHQKPIDHLKGSGCPKCGLDKLKLNNLSNHEEFVRKARAVHGVQYRYPEPYKLARQHLKVECIKHGLFSVTPNNLLRGHGCPVCGESLGEKKVARVLEKLGASFTREKRFPDCRDKRPLRFDFWLPTLNALVEFDGLQHHEPYELFGGTKMFEVTQRRDRIKTAYARKKKIRLIRVKYSVRDIEAFLVKKLGLR